MIALDTETTGLDAFHGAAPFFVTVCDGDDNQTWWEWDVDPLTRRPIVPERDRREVAALIADADEIVGQNVRFDARMLTRSGMAPPGGWPWHRTHDTFAAAHLLASHLPHDLTTLALQYLEVDLRPWETAVGRATNEARRACQQARRRAARARAGVAASLFGGSGGGDGFDNEEEGEADEPLAAWRIAEQGLPEMPSAGADLWRADMWLPRQLARWARGPGPGRLTLGPGWETALRDYSNADSAATARLWPVLRTELKRRGLWEIYLFNQETVRVVAAVEDNSLTLSGPRLRQQRARCRTLERAEGERCREVAASLGFDLTLPKGGAVNHSLREFCFDVLRLPPVRNPKAKTDAPSLDAKHAIPHYLTTLPADGPAGRFVRALLRRRTHGASAGYLDQYEHYWLPIAGEPGWFRLHTNLNPFGTGTLRMSSERPNGQNVKTGPDDEGGKSPRYCFGPAPGREWWTFDARNIELRLPAYEAGELEMIALFEKPDDPPYFGSVHALMFHTIYPEVFEALADRDWDLKKHALALYKKIKNGDFAVQYGSVEESGTADRTYGRAGAFRLVKQRFPRMHGPGGLNEHWIDFARRHGYVETMPDRTVNPHRGYPLFIPRTAYGIKPTTPLNYRIQGTAGWWMRKAMIRVDRFLGGLNKGDLFAGRRWPGRRFVAMQVHDELIVDMPAPPPRPSGRNGNGDGNGDGNGAAPGYNWNLPVAREVRRLMEEGGLDVDVPTPVSVEWHPVSWDEGTSVR